MPRKKAEVPVAVEQIERAIHVIRGHDLLPKNWSRWYESL